MFKLIGREELKKNRFLLIFVIFMGMLYTSKASANSYYLWYDWGGTYHDAEKSPTNEEDDLMCWAASTANILAWTGWGSNIGDADDIFSYFQDYWTDDGGHVVLGTDWWFDGTNNFQGYTGWSQVDVTGGGGFYEGYDIDNYLLQFNATDWAMAIINSLLFNGYATSLGVSDGVDISHAITCWGFEYNEESFFQGIWVTDSDDDKNESNPSDVLKYYDVLLVEDRWYLQDFYGYNTIYINDVIGLAGMPAPEPATILLFGIGLLGIAGINRKRK